MSSEARLYTFSAETKAALRRFRLSTSRSNEPQARIYEIHSSTYEIHASSDETYTTLADLADALPANSPRFALLSYPIQMASGRLSVPYVMLYYLPPTCNANMRMSYASAKELMKNTAEAQRIIEVSDDEEVLEIEGRLKGEE